VVVRRGRGRAQALHIAVAVGVRAGAGAGGGAAAAAKGPLERGNENEDMYKEIGMDRRPAQKN
jgi:hypothetical protein